MFFVPPVFNVIAQKAGLYCPKSSLKAWKLICELTGIAFGLALAAPLGCSIFPQYAQINADDLEENLQSKCREINIKHCVFNKGL